MKNNVTEIVFVLDRSGSMAGYESDTVGGFNATLQKQKGREGKVYVSTVLFDTQSQVVHDRVELSDVHPMTVEDYQVGGCTALLDALGDAIRHIRNIHKYARPEDVPEHTVFIITTDGLENASRRYDKTTVKEMIQRQQEEFGWEFIFLAANIDAVETAADMGIKAKRAANFEQTPGGIRDSFEVMCCAIDTLRGGGDLDQAAWKEKLDDNTRDGGEKA